MVGEGLSNVLNPVEWKRTWMSPGEEDPIHLVEQLAEANEDFRSALLANPRQAIEQAFGVDLPSGWSAEVTVTNDGLVRVART